MIRRITLVLRVVLAGVFLYAAYTKLRQPWLLFAMSIDAYGLLPEWGVLTTARVLPWLELAIGVLLLTGVSVAGCERCGRGATRRVLRDYAAVVREGNGDRLRVLRGGRGSDGEVAYAGWGAVAIGRDVMCDGVSAGADRARVMDSTGITAA